MTCNDCIHYEVCTDHLTRFNCEYLAGDFEKEFEKHPCELFKDKSCLIKLPCKVGDMVYEILVVEWEIGEFEVYHTSYVMNFYGKETIRFFAECHSHEDVDDIHFFREEIGKRIFLTREEAEAKLKEAMK